MKNICDTCYTKVQNSRALLSHKRACKRRNGQWGEEVHMGEKVNKDFIRAVKNSIMSNPRKLRRARRKIEKSDRVQQEKINVVEKHVLRGNRSEEISGKKDNLVLPNKTLIRKRVEVTGVQIDPESEESEIDENGSNFFNSLFRAVPKKANVLSEKNPSRPSLVASPPVHKNIKRAVHKRVKKPTVFESSDSASEWNPSESDESEDSESSLFVQEPPSSVGNRNFLQNLF